MALVGEKTGGVLPVEVDVAEHDDGTIIAQVVQFLRVRASEFFKCRTTGARWVLRSFTPARDDRVVHKLEVHGASCKEPKAKYHSIMLFFFLYLMDFFNGCDQNFMFNRFLLTRIVCKIFI